MKEIIDRRLAGFSCNLKLNNKEDKQILDFLHCSKREFEQMYEKHWRRYSLRMSMSPRQTRVEYFKQTIKDFSTVPYIYTGDGLDDHNRYQRPCSNGVGYVSICPGESGNNWYEDDPFIVRCLTRKYNEFFKGNSSK